MTTYRILLLILVLLKIAIFFAVSGEYDFHRDELLYLALGGHPDWGYWSNPPMIGWLGAIIRHFPAHSLEMVRIFSLLASIGTLLLAVRMASILNGGIFAVAVTGLAILISPPYLRTMVMFQPVVFDVFFWTLCAYFLLCFLKTGENRWLLWLGAAAGLGLLLKYLLLVFAAALVAGLILTPHRRLFTKPVLYAAAGIALLIWLPNLIWQVTNGFPVFMHLKMLSESQLVHVSPTGFLVAQLMSHLPVIILIPFGVAFFFSKTGNPFRLLGWVFIFTELLLLVTRAKDYYSLGLYPFILAAGAVAFEKMTRQDSLGSKIIRGLFILTALMLGLAVSPFSVPYLPVKKMVDFSAGFQQKTGISGPLTWEDGDLHTLPQDYADMLGWREMAELATTAWQQSTDKQHTLIYAENYGQAGAIDWYGREHGLPPVYSFSDTYLLWIPDTLDREITHFIYVNDELGEDIQQLFADIRLVGTLDNAYAREYGTKVYLCTAPRASFRTFYGARVSGIKAALFGSSH